MVSRVVLTVDRNERNLELLAQFLGKEGYQTLPISSLGGFAQALEQSDGLGLALVDISGFDRSIWDYCEQLADKGVPLLVVSPKQVGRIQQESLSHGAQGVLFKPLVVKELTTIIESMIRGDERE